jgi:hypothetical protein
MEKRFDPTGVWNPEYLEHDLEDVTMRFLISLLCSECGVKEVKDLTKSDWDNFEEYLNLIEVFDGDEWGKSPLAMGLKKLLNNGKNGEPLFNIEEE